MANYNRRLFLKTASALGFAGSAGLSPLLSAMPAMAQSNGDYKAFVFVFLFGGMDNWDTIIPYNGATRGEYQQLRGALIDQFAAQGSGRRKGGLDAARNASSKELLLRQSDGGPPSVAPGRHFILPPEMHGGPTTAEPGLIDFYNQGKMAIVGNVGPLFQPTNRNQFISGGADLPPQLFSHNDQQSTWMSLAVEGADPGWGALLAERAPHALDELSTISAGSDTIFLSGENSNQYCISLSGDVALANAITAAFGRYGVSGSRLAAFEREYAADIADIVNNDFRFNNSAGFGKRYKQDYAAIVARANDIAGRINANRDQSENFSDQDSSMLSQQLGRVTEMMALGKTLGLSRQVFFVQLGGFDTHDSEARDLPNLQQTLNDSIIAFQNAVDASTVLDANEVLLATGSDFGRTLTVNGDGTDHGWGGNHFVVGGPVNGRQVFGDIPEATLGHSQDAGNGRLIPTLSVEEYAAPIAKWFGLSNSQINAIFPNLSRFTHSTSNLLQFV